MECKRCNVKIDASSSNCPLCGGYIQKAEKTILSHPANLRAQTLTTNFVNNTFWMCILAVLLCGTIEMLTANTLSWSLIVLVSLALVWFILLLPIAYKYSARKIIFITIVSVILFLIFLTIIIDENMLYAITITIPFIVLSSVLVLLIVMLSVRKIAASTASVFVALCIIGALPIIIKALFFRDNAEYLLWPAQASLVISIFSFLLYVLLERKQVIKSLKTVFHTN